MSIRERLEREVGSVRSLGLAAGVALAVGAAALPLAAAAMLLGGGRWISLPALLPFLVWALALLLAGVVVWRAREWLRTSADRAVLAREIEREQRLRSGSVLGVLELPASPLALRAEERIDAKLSGVRGSLVPSLQRRVRRQGAAAAGVALAALCVLVVASFTSGDGWTALMHPARAWAGTLMEAPTMTGLPPAVMRGQPLTVTVVAPGRRQVTLWHRATGGGWRGDELAVTGGRASLTLPAVDADLLLVASDGRVRSDTVHVAVTDRPFLADVAIRAIYPVYLERAPELLVTGDPVRVPRGTELRISGTSTTALRSVHLATEGDTLGLAVAERSFEGRLLAERDGRWSWAAIARDGEAPEVPQPLDLFVAPDVAPTVEIMSPARDSQVLSTDVMELVARATDDHGLASVTVRSWRRRGDGSVDPEVAVRAEVSGEPHWAGAIMVDLADRELRPGDELRVVVSATDDSPWRQTTTSRELVLRVPSLADQRSNARAAADSAVARALAAASAQRQLAQRTEDAARARDRSGTMDRAEGRDPGSPRENALSFESAERARALAAEQRQLSEEVARMRDAAERLEDQLERAGAMDAELRAQLREAQRLMQEALTPRLAEQLRKLEESAQQLQPDATRQALTDLAEQQRQLREQLARAADMLRRAALEGSMETLRDEADDLARAQQQLADGEVDRSRGTADEPRSGTEPPAGTRGAPSEPSAEELARRSEQLARDIAELRERLAAEKASGGERRADEAARHADASAEAMARAARQTMEDASRTGETGDRQRDSSAGESSKANTGAQQQGGQQQGGQQQGGQQQGGQQQGGQQQGSQQQGSQQQGSQQPGSQQPGGQQQGGQQQGGEQQGGEQQGGGMRQGAAQAASEMRRAAEELAAARAEQVAEWKRELTSALDQAVNELQQMSREQRALEQRTREGADPGQVRGEQGALQQGVQGIAQRLREEGRRSSLLSQGSQDAVARAQREVQQATQQASAAAGQEGGARNAQAMQAADAMAGAAQAMTDAAASLVRDRARANDASSASGMAEMLEALQQLAAQQGGINAQASGLMPGGGGGQRPSAAAMGQARELARQQRVIARQLEALGGGAGDPDAMAAEARALAQALESGALDPSTLNRQQRLFRRMLEAGQTLEQDEVDNQAPRRGETARSTERFAPPDSAVSGRAAERYPIPTWDELRKLNPDDRRVVIEYFRRLNAAAEEASRRRSNPPGTP